MKTYTYLLILVISSLSLTAQETDYNTKKGFIADGYDVVAYFSNQAIKGESKYVHSYDSVKYKFASQKNLDSFKSNPTKYIPEYGGYCAYAVGAKAEKVSIDPETFEIRDGKLYLFYNSWGINTLEKWKDEGAEQLKTKADQNWKKIKTKS